METAITIADVRAHVARWHAAGERVVFVPTMGNLHAGHMSLLEAAREHGDRFVASIFVNPMQFGPNEDFAHYPRTPANDATMLAEVGCNLMFMPEVGEIYPNGANNATRIDVPGISGILCGEFRPGHFEGVATIVAKLFHIVDPDVAIFGEKDYEQLTKIRRMVADLCMPVEVVGAPIIREADGLALSSRNRYRDPGQRVAALALSRALRAGVDARHQGPDAVVEAACAVLRETPGLEWDYVTIDSPDLDGTPVAGPARLLVAARLGTTRLIDNTAVTLEDS